MSSRRAHVLSSWALVGVLGAVEGLYGRTQYLGDWISYLNVSRAVSRLDWKGIFDPMWNAGYPMLIALARSVFPQTAVGEWYAIALLNWIIFLLAYASFRYLMREAAVLYDPSSAGQFQQPIVTWIACFVFLSFSLCFDKVSRVSPDLLVSTLFLLAAAQMLRLLRQPSGKDAAILGAILGAGCWVKGVFLPYAFIFLLTLSLMCMRRKISWRIPSVSAALFLVLFAPYVAAISWSYGEFTLGASGALNYAFHVDHLPHWTNWEGGPPQFGSPKHHSAQLLADLPVFAFQAPFQSTYPPYNNMAYWYEGFHHFYSFRLEAAAILRSFYFLARMARDHPFLIVLGIVLLAMAIHGKWREASLRVVKRYWPLFLPAILGIGTYLLVHVEDRYVGCFFLILSLLPLILLLDPAFTARRSLLLFVAAAYLLGSGAEMFHNLKPTLRAALHGDDFRNDSQWKLATTLEAHGLENGAAVALVGSSVPNYRCSWAYVSRIRIVAEFGSLPWRLEPWDRTPLDHREDAADKIADEDEGQVFWKLTPEQRERVIQAFQSTGAKAVLALTPPDATPEPGWRPVGKTGAWIYSLDSQLAASFSQGD